MAFVALTPWEFAFLADAPLEEPNLLDRLASGIWLRSAELRSEGQRIFERRVELETDTPAEVWLMTTAAAQALVRAPSGDAVLVHRETGDLCIVTAGGCHLLIDDEGVGVWVGEPMLTPGELEDAVAARGGIESATRVRWHGGGEFDIQVSAPSSAAG